MNARSVTIRLAGLQLPVKTTATDEEIQTIVAMIQKRFEGIQKSAQTQPLHNHLALVAMDLAQELINLTQTQQNYADEINALSRQLLEALDHDER